MKTPTKRVFLGLREAGFYTYELAQGVMAYVRQRGGWDVFYHGTTSPEACTGVLKEFKPDGMILLINDKHFAEAALRMPVPVVNVSGSMSLPLPQVRMDDVAAGRMAAEHLIENGFASLGYFGHRGKLYCGRREEGFRQKALEHDLGCQSFFTFYPWSDMEGRTALRKWVTELPRPCGIFSSDGYRGGAAVEAALAAGLRVPQDIAVVGTVNSAQESALSSTPLSSVVSPSRQIGYEAAKLLDRLMSRRRITRREVLINPLGLIVRQSSDVLATKDAELQAAVSYIRENAHRCIDVRDLLERVPLSRRVLERRFRKTLGRTPRQEILRAHLERARSLLMDSDLKMAEVAKQSGFPSYAVFAKTFASRLKTTPLAYRERLRLMQ